MMCTMISDEVPLGEAPFIDITLASFSPKTWEDEIECMARIPLLTAHTVPLSQGKRKHVFSTSPPPVEPHMERPTKKRRQGNKRSIPLQRAPAPGVFLNNKDRRYESIYEALREAAEGDTILLRPGVHSTAEPIVLNKRNITIASSAEALPPCCSASCSIKDCTPPQFSALIATTSSCGVRFLAPGCAMRGVAVKLHGSEVADEEEWVAAQRSTHVAVAVEDEDIQIENCNIEGGHGSGIVIHGDRCLVRASTVHSCSHSAISCHTGSGTRILNNSVILNRGCGISVHGDFSGDIEGNFICQNDAAGIQCMDQSAPRVQDNQILDGATSGVWVRGSSTAVVAKNMLLRNAMAGVRVSENADPLVEENRLCDGRGSGLVVEGAARGRHMRNSMYGHGEAGAWLSGSSQAVLVGNSMTANKASGAVVSGNCHTVWMQNAVERNGVHGVSVRGGARVCMQGDKIAGNGGTGVCVRGLAMASMEEVVVRHNVGAGVRCWDGAAGSLGRCRVEGGAGSRQTIGLLCGGGSAVVARRCTFAGHARANVASSQEEGGRGELQECQVVGAAGEGVLLSGGEWQLRANRVRDNGAAGLRCSGAVRVTSDGDVVERTKGAGVTVDGRARATLRSARVEGNQGDGVVFGGRGGVDASRSLVARNAGVGVRLHGEGGSSAAVTHTCVMGNGQGALRAGRATGMRVEESVFAGGGARHEAAAGVVIEGRLGPHQAFEGNVADGVMFLTETGGAWRRVEEGALGSNAVVCPEDAASLASRAVHQGLVCRSGSEGAAAVQMPDGSVCLASRAGERWAPPLGAPTHALGKALA